jgi:uncharacterized protein
MRGTNAQNGRPLAGIEHLRQSVVDILTTPIGTRVMRRDYGSRLYELVDAPVNRDTLVQIYAAAAEALIRWEPRIRLESVRAERAEPGRVFLEVIGEYLPDGQRILIDGVEVAA